MHRHEANTNSKPHASGHPKGGSGGQALDFGLVEDYDGTGPQKADAADDLSAQPSGVSNPATGVRVLADQHRGGRADGKQHVFATSCPLADTAPRSRWSQLKAMASSRQHKDR